MNVNQKIKELAEARDWSEYRLAKETGLAASTIANIYHRDSIPSIPTLEVLCKTLGITLSEFFGESEAHYLSDEQKHLLHSWSLLSPEQREAFLQLMQCI